MISAEDIEDAKLDVLAHDPARDSEPEGLLRRALATIAEIGAIADAYALSDTPADAAAFERIRDLAAGAQVVGVFCRHCAGFHVPGDHIVWGG